MWNAIRHFTDELMACPGWKEWKHAQVGQTLFSKDEENDVLQGDFDLPVDMRNRHELVMRYLYLLDTVNSLKDCEFYFRRYPFRGLPVTKHAHLTNVCEMYFGRFYEFRERLKRYFEALKSLVPADSVAIGQFIKLFSREFDAELRERNGVHHHTRFDDVGIDRVFLSGILVESGDLDRLWKRQQDAAYRVFVNEWVDRVRRRSARLEAFVEAVASATLESCDFLNDRPR